MRTAACWCSGGHLIDGKNPADNNTLFDIALLRDEKNLVSRARRAGQPPAISDPLRNYGKPTGQDPFGLNEYAGSCIVRVDRRDRPEFNLTCGLV